MPPKRSLAPAGSPLQRGLISSFYHGIKSPENASVVRSIAVFAVSSHSHLICVCVSIDIVVTDDGNDGDVVRAH
ncbi:hypothetical protein HOY80DRAFT_252790 [Tuber brumale]|nr:hypothetical protein HOY80DRAFT_252790 [Tuber brumale]